MAGPRGAPSSEDRLHSPDSLRYEAMREGIQDSKLLRRLARKDSRRLDALCHRLMRGLTDHTLDSWVLRETWRKLLRALPR